MIPISLLKTYFLYDITIKTQRLKFLFLNNIKVSVVYEHLTFELWTRATCSLLAFAFGYLSQL